MPHLFAGSPDFSGFWALCGRFVARRLNAVCASICRVSLDRADLLAFVLGVGRHIGPEWPLELRCLSPLRPDGVTEVLAVRDLRATDRWIGLVGLVLGRWVCFAENRDILNWAVKRIPDPYDGSASNRSRNSTGQ